MEPQLRAGAAIYNAGRYHAAHDAWEDHWLDLEQGTDDEQLLHGLIQFTAAIHHATNGNWSGATGLAESAGGYLEDLPADYRGVNLDDVRDYLATMADDPEVIERGEPLPLVKDGDIVDIQTLGLHATLAAAAVVAEADGFDEEIVELAREYARTDAEEGVASSPFITLLFDFVREPENRGIVFQRLSEHVERRKARNEDVDGLFE